MQALQVEHNKFKYVAYNIIWVLEYWCHQFLSISYWSNSEYWSQKRIQNGNFHSITWPPNFELGGDFKYFNNFFIF